MTFKQALKAKLPSCALSRKGPLFDKSSRSNMRIGEAGYPWDILYGSMSAWEDLTSGNWEPSWETAGILKRIRLERMGTKSNPYNMFYLLGPGVMLGQYLLETID